MLILGECPACGKAGYRPEHIGREHDSSVTDLESAQAWVERLERFEAAVIQNVHQRFGIVYALWVDSPDAPKRPAEVAAEKGVEPDPENAGVVASAYRGMAEEAPHADTIEQYQQGMA